MLYGSSGWHPEDNSKLSSYCTEVMRVHGGYTRYLVGEHVLVMQIKSISTIKLFIII